MRGPRWLRRQGYEGRHPPLPRRLNARALSRREGYPTISTIHRTGRLLAPSMPVSSSARPGSPPLWLLASTSPSVEAMTEEDPMVKSRFKPTEEAKCHGRTKPTAVIC